MVKRPEDNDWSHDKHAHQIAKPPNNPESDDVIPPGVAGEAQTNSADSRAGHCAGAEADQREFSDTGHGIEGSASAGPYIDQISANDRFECIAGCNRHG